MKPKSIIWVSSSKKDLRGFPEDVQDAMGYALYFAQIGDKHENTKPLKGFGGADIMEIVDKDMSGTYRVVYALRFKDVVCVLHAFQKKSKQGIKTPKQDIDLIHNRLQLAQEMYNEFQKSKKS